MPIPASPSEASKSDAPGLHLPGNLAPRMGAGGRDLEGDPRTFHPADWPAFGYSAAAAAASGTRFGAGVSRTPTAETIAASTPKPASA